MRHPLIKYPRVGERAGDVAERQRGTTISSWFVDNKGAWYITRNTRRHIPYHVNNSKDGMSLPLYQSGKSDRKGANNEEVMIH
jgi:hypothetical protein